MPESFRSAAFSRAPGPGGSRRVISAAISKKTCRFRRKGIKDWGVWDMATHATEAQRHRHRDRVRQRKRMPRRPRCGCATGAALIPPRSAGETAQGRASVRHCRGRRHRQRHRHAGRHRPRLRPPFRGSTTLLPPRRRLVSNGPARTGRRTKPHSHSSSAANLHANSLRTPRRTN